MDQHVKVLDQVHLVSVVDQMDLVDPHVVGQMDLVDPHVMVLVSTPLTVGRARLPGHWQNVCEAYQSGKGGFPVQEEEEEEGQY